MTYDIVINNLSAVNEALDGIRQNKNELDNLYTSISSVLSVVGQSWDTESMGGVDASSYKQNLKDNITKMTEIVIPQIEKYASEIQELITAYMNQGLI